MTRREPGAGDYVVPNVPSPRDLVSRPDNMDETVLSSYHYASSKLLYHVGLYSFYVLTYIL